MIAAARRRAGYFPLLAFLTLLSVTLALPSCNLIPQRGVVAEVDTVYEDGSEGEAGSMVYTGPDGTDTANAVDAASGDPNPRAKENDLDKIPSNEKVNQATNWIPPPFGWIAAMLGIATLAGARVYLAKQNADRKKAGGGKPK